MPDSPEQLRKLINERLALFADSRFEYMRPAQRNEELDEWAIPTKFLSRLRGEKASFFESYGYNWAFDASAYNSGFEAHLQWRLLNALSDISTDHPSIERCRDIVVRVLPSSCARPHLRQIEQYQVIVLTSGYLSVLKGFMRLWIRGCAFGRAITKRRPTNYKEFMADYLLAVRREENALRQSAMAYGGALFQLLENQMPFMDRESLFDEQLVKREEFGVQFGMWCTAIDGFLLFHEAAHVLAGDAPDTDRTLELELHADRSSVSLCIIDEARDGGVGTVHIGAPIFYRVELLRLLCEEILEMKAGRHNPKNGRYPGIVELMLRSTVYEKHVYNFLGRDQHAKLCEWEDAMSLVFNTVRWSLLHTLGQQGPLHDFVVSNRKINNGDVG